MLCFVHLLRKKHSISKVLQKLSRHFPQRTLAACKRDLRAGDREETKTIQISRGGATSSIMGVQNSEFASEASEKNFLSPPPQFV